MNLPNCLIALDKVAKAKCLFIVCLAQSDNVSKACRVSGISRETAYQWRKQDQWFADVWKQAKQEYLDNFEASGRLFAIQSKDSNRILAYLKVIHPDYRGKPNPAKSSKVVTNQQSPDLDYSKLTVDELVTLKALVIKCAA